jgi:hypothetical protein
MAHAISWATPVELAEKYLRLNLGYSRTAPPRRDDLNF